MPVNEAPPEQAMDAQQQGQGQAQGQGSDQGSGGDPMKAIQDLGSSLSGLLDALSQSNAPKEVLAPLQAAVKSFGDFADALQGKGQQQLPMADMNQAGNQNAQPANY